MADSSVPITAGTGTAISTRTNASSEHLQVVCIGIDGSNSVVPSDATQGLAVDVTRVQGTVTVSGTVTTNHPVTGVGTLHAAATTAATQFAANTCKYVIITAEAGNTDTVVIGNSAVVHTAGSQQGTPLAAGDSVGLPVTNTNLLYHRAVSGTQNLSVTYLT